MSSGEDGGKALDDGTTTDEKNSDGHVAVEADENEGGDNDDEKNSDGHVTAEAGENDEHGTLQRIDTDGGACFTSSQTSTSSTTDASSSVANRTAISSVYAERRMQARLAKKMEASGGGASSSSPGKATSAGGVTLGAVAVPGANASASEAAETGTTTSVAASSMGGQTALREGESSTVLVPEAMLVTLPDPESVIVPVATATVEEDKPPQKCRDSVRDRRVMIVLCSILVAVVIIVSVVAPLYAKGDDDATASTTNDQGAGGPSSSSRPSFVPTGTLSDVPSVLPTGSPTVSSSPSSAPTEGITKWVGSYVGQAMCQNSSRDWDDGGTSSLAVAPSGEITLWTPAGPILGSSPASSSNADLNSPRRFYEFSDDFQDSGSDGQHGGHHGVSLDESKSVHCGAKSAYVGNKNIVRFVRVQLRGKNVLSLGEVEVFDEDDVNVARGKSATQSSHYGYVGYYPPDNAVDGFAESFTHTNDEDEAWWEVDLGEAYNVKRVVVRNRVDCCTDRLSDSDVELLGEDGTAVLASAYIGNAAGVPSFTFNFDAGSSYIEIPPATDLGSFSVGIWFRLEGSPGRYSRIVDFGSPNGGDGAFLISPAHGSCNNKLGAAMRGAGPTILSNVCSEINPEPNEWHHVAFTYDKGGSGGKLYFNSAIVGSDPYKDQSFNDWLSADARWYIGRSNWSADPYFLGHMQGLRIYNYALSESDLEALYGSTHFPDTYTFNLETNEVFWEKNDPHIVASVTFRSNHTNAHFWNDAAYSTVGKSFTGTIQLNTTHGLLDYRGFLGVTEWVGSYVGQARLGGPTQAWGVDWSPLITISPSGVVTIDSHTPDTVTYDFGTNELRWEKMSDPYIVALITFHSTHKDAFYWNDKTDNTVGQSFTGCIQNDPSGGCVAFRGVMDDITKWVGSYSGEGRFGASNGVWANGGTYTLVITPTGDVFLNGYAPDTATYDANTNKLSWSRSDPHFVVDITFHFEHTSAYYWDDKNGNTVGQSFSGRIQNNPSHGFLDFRGVLDS